MFEVPATNCMTGFVVGNDLFFFWGDDLILFLQSTDHPINGILEITHVNSILSFPGSDQRGLITNVCYICPGKTRRLLSQFMNIQGLRNFYWSQVYFKYRFSSNKVGTVNRYLPVETPWAKKCTIQNIGPVGR